MLIPFILGGSLVLLSCHVVSRSQTPAPTPTITIPAWVSSSTSTSASSRTPTNTPTQTSTPDPSALQLQAVLNAVAAKLSSCRSYGYPHGTPEVSIEYRAEGPSASLLCMFSADAHYSISISASDLNAVATDQFREEQADNGGTCFHGYIVYENISRSPRERYIHRHSQEWRAGRWVVSIRTSYDYGYAHYAPQEFSEAIYAFGVEQGLIPAGTCP
jgi:hypothetical protein